MWHEKWELALSLFQALSLSRGVADAVVVSSFLLFSASRVSEFCSGLERATMKGGKGEGADEDYTFLFKGEGVVIILFFIQLIQNTG